jgi:hypothetical protein
VTLVLALAAGAAGCASGGGGQGGPDQRTLAREEILASGYQDAYSAVQALRPQWLWTRGTTSINSPETIKVYLDNSRMGGVDQLRQIPVRSIASIRYMDALEATNRWGLDHGLGAILVSTRQERN